jgi:hypothetical protein
MAGKEQYGITLHPFYLSERSPNEPFQPSIDPEFLHTLAYAPDLVHLLLAVFPHDNLAFESLDLDVPAVQQHGEVAVPSSFASHAVLGEFPSEVLHEIGALDADQTVVDGITLEDVAERTGDDQRDARILDGSGGLFPGRTRAKVETGDEEDTRAGG